MDTENTVANAMPRINEPAPAFEARTTHGVKKLEDYRGKWLVLFSHPAGFTPVCTTEFTAFAKRYPDFQAMNTELLGLSIDSYYSHVAWVRNIKEKFGVDIPFPIIEDLSMKVARAYGMIHPAVHATEAVRSVFIIGPDKKLRLTMTYPMNVGRNFDEILRVIDALQTAEGKKLAMPADWRPGDRAIIPLSVTDDEAAQKYPEGYQTLRPYLRTVATDAA